MSDHITNGITNIHLIIVEVQLVKLQVIIASVLNFSLPVGDIISVAVRKDVPPKQMVSCYAVRIRRVWASYICYFFKTKNSSPDTPCSVSWFTVKLMSSGTIKAQSISGGRNWILSARFYCFNAGSLLPGKHRIIQLIDISYLRKRNNYTVI